MYGGRLVLLAPGHGGRLFRVADGDLSRLQRVAVEVQAHGHLRPTQFVSRSIANASTG